MVKKSMSSKNKKGILPIIIGLFLILSLNNIDGGRELKPEFDGSPDDFDLEIKGYSPKGEVGDLYWVSLYIKNNDDHNSGKMFVQCSILDRDKEDWLVGLQSATILSVEDNCVDNEPFTQTAIIELDGMQHQTTTFSFKVPNTPNGRNVIWCEAFEQCYSEGVNTYSSSYDVQEIVVLPNDNDITNDNTQKPSIQKDSCDSSWDCGLFSGTGCYQGYCIDKDNIPEDTDKSSIDWPDLSDNVLKDWMGNNKIILSILGVLLLIIGATITFKEEKQRF